MRCGSTSFIAEMDHDNYFKSVYKCIQMYAHGEKPEENAVH